MSGYVSAVYFDDVLNMWERGMSAPEITDSIGDPLTIDRVTDIIKRARRACDPRAVAKKRGGSPPGDSVWTPERRARLVDLIAADYTTRHIAGEMGMTTGQIAGYISRNGLRLSRPPNSDSGKQKAPKPEKSKKRFTIIPGFRRSSTRVQPKSVEMAGAERILMDMAVPLPGRKVTVQTVEEHHCRYPLGDPRSSHFTFCGDDRAPGYSYCAAHCRIAYMVPA